MDANKNKRKRKKIGLDFRLPPVTAEMTRGGVHDFGGTGHVSME